MLLVTTLLPLSQLSIDDFVYGYFPQDHPFTQSIATLDNEFPGSVQLHYKFDSGSANGLFNSTHLEAALRWVDWAKQQPEVTGGDHNSRAIA